MYILSLMFHSSLYNFVFHCIILYFLYSSCITDEVSLGGTADSFYEYLIKSYVMTGEKDQEAADLFFDSIKVRYNPSTL